MQPQTPNPIALRIDDFEKLSSNRSLLCAALIAILIFNGIFTALIHYSFAFMELPCLVGVIILIKKPSLARSLLPQQYLGVCALIVSFLKSLFFSVYTTYYLVNFFLDIEQSRHQESANPKTDIPPEMTLIPSDNSKIFPEIASDAGSISTVFAAVMTILFVLVISSELLSVFWTSAIMRTTYMLVKIVKEIGFSPVRVLPVQQTGDHANEEEIRRLQIGVRNSEVGSHSNIDTIILS